MSQLKSKVVTGSAWMVGMRATVNLVGIFTTLILARLLTPGDFGVVALAGSAYLFFSILGQFGFDTALIHMKDPDEDHYNTAWTANILVGLVIATVTVLIAGPAAEFLDDSRVKNVIYAFAVLSFAKGFENIGVVNFRKSLEFRGDFLYFVFPKLSSALVGIIAALVLRNYWALVIGMLTSQLVTIIYSHVSQPFRPKPSLSSFSELFGYSRWIVITNVLNYFSGGGIQIALGKIKDASAVGAYSIAEQIASLPTEEILAPINRALFPGFSTVSNEPDRLRGILVRVLSVASLISVPSAFGIIVLAEPLVYVLLGNKWQAAASILQVLGLVSLVIAMRSALGPVLLARGRPKTLTQANAASLLIKFPLALLLLPKMGAVGVAYATLAGALITTPILVSVVKHDIGLRWSMLARATWRPFLASICMVLIVHNSAGLPVFRSIPDALQLVVLIIAGAVAYFLSLLTFWTAMGFPDGGEREALNLLRSRVRWLDRCLSH